ncbi:MAG: hypothetical protein AUF79_07760 [Crenarchaeota archaeon 13_1_20CM_2_51_8]|nr:MAG: hypothetical protein AUF79_07760 [Crenarchaeota archaeon 13_1_20CM_2_51_8]
MTGTSAATTCQVTYTPGGTSPRTDTLTANYAPVTTHLTSSGTFQLSITQVALTGGHAELDEWEAAPLFRVENLRRNATQTLFAFGENDGNITVNVYVKFDIRTLGPTSTRMTLYTQVVRLTPDQEINGKLDSRFSVKFNPTPGVYVVTATIYWSPSSTTIGDPSFKANRDTETFVFVALGANFNGPSILFLPKLDGATGQTFTLQIINQSNTNLLVSVTITLRNPDATITRLTSSIIPTNPGQIRNDVTIKTPILTVTGTYCFRASLKYGIDTNNNGALDSNEILGTGKTVSNCFTVAPQGTSTSLVGCHDDGDDDD